ncbi:MAG: DUF192 domain-containing protein [Rhodospirillales bacterium]|jgi:uncharacterized membrane protein (UPF0127 family)
MLDRRLVLFAVAGSVLPAGTGLAQMAPRAPSFPRSELTIHGQDGRVHRFQVEVADTDERRAWGLMHRDAMPPDHGMIFDFKRDQPVAMWMRNTRIPLDMLFIDREGRVVKIHARAVPFDETSIHSDVPVRGVLELNGGTAARLGLKPGDVVRHPVFRTGA